MNKHFGLIGLLFISASALADLSSPVTPGWELSPKGDLTVGTSVVKESDADAPKILVRAEYRGLKHTTSDPNVIYRYFWVKAQLGFNTGSGDDGATVLNSAVVTLTPVTRVENLGDVVSTIRFSQLDYRRNVELNINESINVTVVGFSKSIEKPLFGRDGAAQLARFTKFAQVAVDLVGLRMVRFYDENSPFVGVQIGGVQASGGLGWNISDSVSLKVSLNAKANLAYGQYMIGETDFYGQVSLLFKRALERYTVYLASGRTDYAHDSFLHSEYYVMIGLNVGF